MRQGHYQENWVDENGNPAGGVATGRGFTISWQNGPLGKLDTVGRKEPNGAFVEDVLGATLGRMEFYQNASGGKFSCDENAEAIEHIVKAMQVLDKRTQRRVSDKTEGTHEGN